MSQARGLRPQSSGQFYSSLLTPYSSLPRRGLVNRSQNKRWGITQLPYHLKPLRGDLVAGRFVIPRQSNPSTKSETDYGVGLTAK